MELETTNVELIIWSVLAFPCKNKLKYELYVSKCVSFMEICIRPLKSESDGTNVLRNRHFRDSVVAF